MSNEAVQSEMPFAVVFGEQMTEMPRDLYIRRRPWKCSSTHSRGPWTCCCT